MGRGDGTSPLVMCSMCLQQSRGICNSVLYTCMGFRLCGLCLVHVHCRLLSLCICIHYVNTFGLCGNIGYMSNTIW